MSTVIKYILLAVFITKLVLAIIAERAGNLDLATYELLWACLFAYMMRDET